MIHTENLLKRVNVMYYWGGGGGGWGGVLIPLKHLVVFFFKKAVFIQQFPNSLKTPLSDGF